MGNHDKARAAKILQKKKRSRRIVMICIAAVLVIGILYVCVFEGGYKVSDKNNPVATITMKNGDKIIIELFPEKAPNTVANFIELANSGFYDGLTYHRTERNLLIQGGDPDGNGTGGPGYSIKGEFAANGVNNDISHVRGTLSMARANHPDSAGSQFFIVLSDYPAWDGSYAAFGSVVKGIENAEKICASAQNSNLRVIKKIRVDTKGVEYAAEKIYE